MSSPSLITVEEELSLAYLHAVCARARVSCFAAPRQLDNDGIDALLKARFPQADYPQTEDAYLEVQMKATKKQPSDDGENFSYWLQGHKRYEVLRRENRQLARVLVVLFLPEDDAQWLSFSQEDLILRRCAYWVSLWGAPMVDSETGANVKMPKGQSFSPENLEQLMLELSLGNLPRFINRSGV